MIELRFYHNYECLFQLYLITFVYEDGETTILVGIDVNIVDTMKNPLLTATAPPTFGKENGT